MLRFEIGVVHHAKVSCQAAEALFRAVTIRMDQENILFELTSAMRALPTESSLYIRLIRDAITASKDESLWVEALAVAYKKMTRIKQHRCNQSVFNSMLPIYSPSELSKKQLKKDSRKHWENRSECLSSTH